MDMAGRAGYLDLGVDVGKGVGRVGIGPHGAEVVHVDGAVVLPLGYVRDGEVDQREEASARRDDLCRRRQGPRLEGVEVALAGVQNSVGELKSESADLLYHLLVLLASHDLPLQDVVSELRLRHKDQ